MKHKWLKLPVFLLGGCLAVLGLSLLEQLTEPKEQDPTKQNYPMLKDGYNGYGLEAGEMLSQELIFETDRLVCYTDRVFRHFSYEQENVVDFARILENMSAKSDRMEQLYVLPVPPRIVFEEGYEEDKKEYQAFLEALGKALPERASLTDCRELLAKHENEYLFFRTEDAWTARGAYYAVSCLCETMGTEAIPLAAYEESMYSNFKGTVFLEAMKYEAYEDTVYQIPEDPLFYYLLPGAPNRAQIIWRDEEGRTGTYPVPVVTSSAQNLGAFLASIYERAVVEGGGEQGNLLLICDAAGKVLAPFLANYCQELYVVNVETDSCFYEEFAAYLEENDITAVVYSQSAWTLGERSFSSAVNAFLEDGRE